jgi:prepilin-type N-terminal cleavage/methylation domain-containing protein
MRRKRPESISGFTLLELVVVLAILAIVTALATREISYVQDQQRFDASQRGLQAIQEAVLGSPDDRLPDGTRTVSGFVSDMGRLPRVVLTSDNDPTLRELWVNTQPDVWFDFRPATNVDLEVRVPCGWRGPYIRLPFGSAALRDGWGNPFLLLSSDDIPLTAADQEIRIVRHLGANGHRDTADAGYDRDMDIAFSNQLFLAGIKGYVDVDDVPAGTNWMVTVRVFGPDPERIGGVKAWPSSEVSLSASSQVFYEIPVSIDGPTIGQRAIRAYLTQEGIVYRRSAVKHVSLRPGVNPLNLTIDR